MWLARHQQRLTLGVAGAALAIAALAPILVLIAQALSGGTAVFAVLGVARPWVLLGRSLLLSGAVTLVALAVGVPLGLLVARFDVPKRRALWLLHAFPMLLPPFLLGLGWFHLLGREGIVGSELSARLLFSEVGVVAVLGLAFAPVVTSLLAVGVLGVDRSLEEAARLSARPWRVATRILLPAARPALALASIVVFSLSLSELGVPMFLRVDVYPAAVFARLGGVDYAPGEAFALVLPLLPVALALLALERGLAGARSFAVLGLRGQAREPLRLGRFRLAATTGGWLVAALSVLPLAVLAARAAGGGFSAAVEWIGRAPVSSLLAGAAAATIMTSVGLVLGHAAARRLPGSAWLDGLAVLAFLTPSSVLGVGLISLWNRPATQILYGSLAILVIGYCARYTAVASRTVACAVAQSPTQLEEAAAAAGARFLRRLMRIVLPVHARGVGFAWLLGAVFCLRDLETAVLFYPPGREPLTVRIFTLEANGPPAVVAALATLHAGMTALALAAIGALILRRGGSRKRTGVGGAP
jgi:iron(III) transport system permease protein